MIVLMKKLCPMYIVCCLTSASNVYTGDFFQELDLFNDPTIENALATQEFHINRAASTQDAAQVLIDLGAATILQQQFFLATNPLNVRDLVDYPEYLPQRKYYCYDWILGGHLFWNQLSRAQLTKGNTAISSYLAIQSPELLESLSTALDIVREEFSKFGIDPLDVLPLFSNLTVQQRRFGVMLHAERQWDRADFRIIAPFYYLERNFFLTIQEQIAIEQALGKASEEDTELFAKNHLISDKLGLGDTRLTFDYPVVDKELYAIRLGLLATIPTSFAVSSALLGSNFTKRCNRPHFSFEELFSLGSQGRSGREQATAMAQTFLMGTLDNLAANLLDTDLGNGGHVGIGAYLQSQTALCKFINRPWTSNFVVRGRISLEYLCPARETRMFVEQSNTEAFNALGLNRSKGVINQQIQEDPAYADQVLTFLDAQFVDKFNPFVFCTRVFPGVVFRSTTKFLYEGASNGFHIGSDFWLQGQEKLRDIEIVTVDGRPYNIDVAKATKPLAYQGKIHGSLFHKVNRTCQSWTIILNGDTTVWGSGLGNDFTISLNLEINF